MTLPRYEELPIAAGLPERSSWSLWGEHDQLGTINLLTEERALRAVETVKRGVTFPLSWPLELPAPALWGRPNLEHHVTTMYPYVIDDSVNHLSPQASSQWDALCHVGHPVHGFYNGATEVEVTSSQNPRNGIENVARKGIVGRGVLLDVARHWRNTGRELRADATVELTPDDLEEVRVAQQVHFEAGDILLIRTGWMEWYEQADERKRAQVTRDSITNNVASPALAGTEEIVAWLSDNHYSAVAADNPVLEAWPHAFEPDTYLHFRIIPLLGMTIGELWYLEDLAFDCADDGRFDFLLTSAPLNLRGGTGSPPNALAIK